MDCRWHAAWFSWCTGVWRQVSGGQWNKRGWSVLCCQWASCVLSLILMQSGGSYFVSVSNLSMDKVWNTPLIVWSAVLHSVPGSFNRAVNVPWIPNMSSTDNDKVLLADHHHILIKKHTVTWNSLLLRQISLYILLRWFMNKGVVCENQLSSVAH